MKIKEKIAILILAILISFIGFNLIASPFAVDSLQVRNNTGYTITYTYYPVYTI